MRFRRRGLAFLTIAVLMTGCGGTAGLPDSLTFTGIDAELRKGPGHCDWDDTYQIHVRSDRLTGTDQRNPGGPNVHMFVKDPEAIPEYEYEVLPDPSRSVPADAEKLGTGSQEDRFELWYSPTDPHYIYLVDEDSTKAWVRATDWGLCS